MKLIVIDDLSPVALTYKSILVQAGFDVEVFTRSDEAQVELAQNAGAYDMMITDIYMNEVTGIELINQAKENNPMIKVLSITGGGGFDQDTNLMAQARELSDFLAFKPINSTQLVNMVRNLLGSKAQDVA